MTKSVLMASEGDPFTTLFCLKLWKERWYDEVDHIYINLNVEYYSTKVTAELIERLIEYPQVTLIYHTMRQGNGESLTELLKICKEDLVLLLENDGYIFSSGVVRELFGKIESRETDAIGSPRGSCTPELYKREVEHFKLDVSNYGDAGPNYWPNFFFCKKADLLKTDLNFASCSFRAEEYCKELDYTFKEENAGDTFVWTSIQLRKMGLRFFNVPQHKASPREFEDREKKENNWHPSQKDFRWIHAGSLSSGWGGYLWNKPLPEMTLDEKLEFENRCAWWFLVSTSINGFEEFKVEYWKGIESLIQRAGLNHDNINEKMKLYKNIMNL